MLLLSSRKQKGVDSSNPQWTSIDLKACLRRHAFMISYAPNSSACKNVKGPKAFLFTTFSECILKQFPKPQAFVETPCKRKSNVGGKVNPIEITC